VVDKCGSISGYEDTNDSILSAFCTKFTAVGIYEPAKPIGHHGFCTDWIVGIHAEVPEYRGGDIESDYALTACLADLTDGTMTVLPQGRSMTWAFRCDSGNNSIPCNFDVGLVEADLIASELSYCGEKAFILRIASRSFPFGLQRKR
jgi:hypothetical protein